MDRAKPLWAGLALSFALLCLYSLTYSARLESSDELQLFDVVTSLANFGDWGRDESIWTWGTFYLDEAQQIPLADYNDEPLVPLLGMVLYRLAESLGNIGFVHAVWWLNIIITATSAFLLYQIALQFGARPWEAALVALSFGALTVAWGYTRTLFRESAVLAALLLAAYGALRSRSGAWQGRIFGYGLMALGFFSALQSKNSALFALPALIVLALPAWPFTQARWCLRLAGAGLLFALTFITLMAFVPAVFDPISALVRPLIERAGGGLRYSQLALWGYLFSPNGSLWSSSPVLLLAFPAGWLAYRQGQLRLVWVVLLLVAGYAFGHAYLTNQHWYGGLNWPPRFLVPTLPFVVLLLIPLLRQATQRPTWWALILPLALASLGVQVVAGLSFWEVYPQHTSTPNALTDGASALLDWSNARWLILPRTWDALGLNIAWARIGQLHYAWGYAALTLIGLSGVWWALKGRRQRWLALGLGAGMLVWGVWTLAGLRALYANDSAYEAQNVALHQSLSVLAAHARPDDAWVLSSQRYDRFILNYNHSKIVRPLILINQPGEGFSELVPPRLPATTASERLDTLSRRILDLLPLNNRRVWLLTHTGPYTAWATRPVEEYLAQGAYPLGASVDEPQVRLLSYDLSQAPYPDGFSAPEMLTDHRFGDALRLVGYTLPRGATYRAGDSLPIALQWRTDAPLNDDLNIAVFIAPLDAAAPPYQGQDSAPSAGFAPTTRWQLRMPVWDRRAIALPLDARSGEYALWLVVYRVVDGQVERLPITQGATQDGTIASLPTTITIR